MAQRAPTFTSASAASLDHGHHGFNDSSYTQSWSSCSGPLRGMVAFGSDCGFHSTAAHTNDRWYIQPDVYTVGHHQGVETVAETSAAACDLLSADFQTVETDFLSIPYEQQWYSGLDNSLEDGTTLLQNGFECDVSRPWTMPSAWDFQTQDEALTFADPVWSDQSDVYDAVPVAELFGEAQTSNEPYFGSSLLPNDLFEVVDGDEAVFLNSYFSPLAHPQRTIAPVSHARHPCMDEAAGLLFPDFEAMSGNGLDTFEMVHAASVEQTASSAVDTIPLLINDNIPFLWPGDSVSGGIDQPDYLEERSDPETSHEGAVASEESC